MNNTIVPNENGSDFTVLPEAQLRSLERLAHDLAYHWARDVIWTCGFSPDRDDWYDVSNDDDEYDELRNLAVEYLDRRGLLVRWNRPERRAELVRVMPDPGWQP